MFNNKDVLILRKRKKRVLCAALVLLLTIAFYTGLGRLYEYAAGQNIINTYNQQRFDDFYAAPPGSVDWVFTGSSHSYCTFDPENFDKLGVNTFQMGMPLQLLDGTYYTIQEILKYQPPSTVVLELYWYVLEKDFDAKPMEMLFQVMQNEELENQFLQEVLPWNEKIKYYLKPIRYQADFLAYVNNKLLNVINYRFGLKKTIEPTTGEEYYKGRGYVCYDYTMPDTLYREISTQPYTDMYHWEMAAEQAEYLKKIAALCAENNIRLLLATAPVSNVQFARIKNYDHFHEAIQTFADSHNLSYLDFNRVNQEIGLFGDDCFFDAGHLNDRGVKKADEYFITWING